MSLRRPDRVAMGAQTRMEHRRVDRVVDDVYEHFPQFNRIPHYRGGAVSN